MSTSDEVSFGQLVGSYRTLRANVSQSTLASWVGISGVAYRNWEIDENRPSAQHLQKLLEVFLEHSLFTPRKEIEEARALWHASKVNVVFDQIWTNALTNTREPKSDKKSQADAALTPTVKMPNPAEAALLDQRPHASPSTQSETDQFDGNPDSHIEGTPHLVDASPKKEVSSPSPDVLSQDTMETDPSLEGEDPMEKLRRDMLQLLQRLGLVTATTIVPAIGQQDLIAAVRAVLYPSGLGDKELGHLEQKIRSYWQARQNMTIAPTDLLLDVVVYVQEVTALLGRSLFPSIRTRLCACLSQGMLLIGVISYDAGQFQRARRYYQTAIDAAREAEHNILQALAWVWDSYSWMRSNEEDRYEHAQVSVNKACGFASLESDLAVRCNALEASAEVHAYLKEKDACIEVLDSLAELAGCVHGNWWYIHQFDVSKLNGVLGICLQQFYRPSAPDTDPLLEDARQALTDALSQPNVLALRQAFHVVDMAQVHARKGEVESACNCARQIITIASTKFPIRQRLWTVCTLLEPYADVAAVKELDKEIRALLIL